MSLANRRFVQLLESSYFQQAASSSYLVLVMVLVSMIASGCLLRSVAKDHVRESILSDLYTLDLNGQSSQDIWKSFQGLFSQRSGLGQHGLLVVHETKVLDNNAEVACLGLPCSQLGSADDLLSLTDDRFVGIEVKPNARDIYFVGYDIQPMLARVQVAPLIAGLILFLVLVAGLIISLRSTRKNLSRIDVVVDGMRSFARGDRKSFSVINGRHDEIDRLAEEVQQNLALIDRLLEEVAHLSQHVAHELRTPLTRLQNKLVDIIDKTDSEMVDDLEALFQESERIQHLFSALMRLGEVETGRCYFREKSINVAALLNDLADYYLPLAEENEFVLTVRVANQCVISADKTLLFQALANLLENSLKYAKSGTQIELFAEQKEAALWLGVADNGQGIPEHLRVAAQQRFSRLDHQADDGGYGLGLSLVKAIAERHGGSLVLDDNEPGLKAYLLFPMKV